MDPTLAKLALDSRVLLRRVRVPRCAVCRGVFATRAALRAHTLSVHGGTREHTRTVTKKYQYTCSVCGSTFNCKLKFSQHVRSHADANNHRCNVCPGTFKQLSQLRSHVEGKHNGHKRICDICSWAFKHKAELSSHARVHGLPKIDLDDHAQLPKSASYTCIVCKKDFNNITELNIHKIVHTSNQRNERNVQKKFTPKLPLHGDVLNSKKQDPVNSKQQDRLNSKKQDILNSQPQDLLNSKQQDLLNSKKQDLLNSKQQDLLNSKQQDLLNSKQQDLQNSKQQDLLNSEQQDLLNSKQQDMLNSKQQDNTEDRIKVHNGLSIESGKLLGDDPQEPNGDSGKESHICDACGKIFKSKLCFDYHMNKHLGINPFPCEICGKPYASPTSLSIHVRTHRDEHSYSCVKCAKTFKQFNQLKRHELTHVARGPYQCDECNSSFKFSCNLSRHMAVHSGKRLFQCDICLKEFGFKYNLTRHMIEKHVHILPFACKICLRTFDSKSLLIRHKVSKHKPPVKKIKYAKRGRPPGLKSLQVTQGAKSESPTGLNFISPDSHPMIVRPETPEREYTFLDTIRHKTIQEYIQDENYSEYPEEDSYSAEDRITRISWVDGGLLLYMREDADSKRFACIGLNPTRGSTVLEHEYTGVL